MLMLLVLDYSYEKLQEIFVQKLKDQYEHIYAFYNDMFTKCVLESYKKKFKSLTVGYFQCHLAV